MVPLIARPLGMAKTVGWRREQGKERVKGRAKESLKCIINLKFH